MRVNDDRDGSDGKEKLGEHFLFFFGRTFDVFGVVRKLKKWGFVVPPVATLYHFE